MRIEKGSRSNFHPLCPPRSLRLCVESCCQIKASSCRSTTLPIPGLLVASRGMTSLAEYHQRTKHSPASVRANRHMLDWAIQPLPFKIYEGVPSLPLPRELGASAMPALQAIAAPAGGEVATPDLRQLARLLHFSAGIIRRKEYPGGQVMYFRAAACTGALYHVDLYVVCGELPRPGRRRLPLRSPRRGAAPAARAVTSAPPWSRRAPPSPPSPPRRRCWCAPRPSGATPGSTRPAPIATASGTAAPCSPTCSRWRRPTASRRGSCWASSTPP